MGTGLKLVIGVAALAVAGAVAAVAVLVSRPSTSAPTAPVVAPATATTAPDAPAGFPAPPAGAVVFSRELGDDVAALALTPGPKPVAQVSLLGGQGGGVRAQSVTISGRRADEDCGRGCYRTSLSAQPHQSVAVSIVLDNRRTTWRVALPRPWPPADATAIMQRASKTWRALSSVAYVDHLASDPTHAVTSRWRVASPDRAAYTIVGGGAGIVIGGSRWDRTGAGQPWVKSPQSVPIEQPSPFWVAVTNAHVLSRGRLGGHPVATISFFDPSTPAWFQAVVQTDTFRTVDLRMNTTAHFMHDTYGDFNTAALVVPPR